jgi:hypothetical protein
MKLTYTLTLADLRAAYGLHRRQKLRRRLAIYIWPVLTVISFVGALAFAVTQHTELFSQCIAVFAGSLVGTIAGPILRFINLRKAFRRLQPTGSTDRLSSIAIEDEYILREHQGSSELKLMWSAVFDLVQDEKITMIYTNKDCFLLFPTQTMSPAQRTELSELVARNLVRK